SKTAIENIVAVRILSLNNQQLQATVLICSSKSMLLKGRAAAVSSLLLLVLLLVGTRCQARPVRGPESEEHEEFYPEEEEEEFFPGKKGGSVVSEELLKKLLAGRDEVSRSSKDIQKGRRKSDGKNPKVVPPARKKLERKVHSLPRIHPSRKVGGSRKSAPPVRKEKNQKNRRIVLGGSESSLPPQFRKKNKKRMIVGGSESSLPPQF
uniref:KI67 protein n=3 Tax=Macrostomum lignano TaxID=282301 RepID=A0A1I8IUW5_9PLAT